ncbi:MAG: hypothetical protein PWP55_900 [Clostridiales bacterium]|nr:hypothetical protein [Clostridiales bacterium]
MCLNNMKGTVVSTWISTLKELYGEDTVNAALERLGWDVSRIIAPLDDIADEQAKAIIEHVAHDAGKEPANVWRDLGQHNIYTFSKWFPSYFERSSLKGFLLMMDAVHAQLTKMIRGAKPPRLICTEVTPDQIDMEYISKRGLFDYFLGLLEGSAAFFNEQLDFNIIETGKRNDLHYMKVRLKFQKNYEEIKSYNISRFLSFGIFNDVNLKSGFITGIATFATSWLFPGLSIGQRVTYGIVMAVIGYIVSRIVMAPMKLIEEEMDKLAQLDFSHAVLLHSHDNFQRLMDKINTVKSNITKDMVFLKGGTDDMYNFARNFSDIAMDMKGVSDTISDVVQDVANGAVYQADETVNAVGILDNDIRDINQLAEQEENSREQLERAVENIQTSSQNVRRVSDALVEVKDNFSAVNEQSANLVQSADDILQISAAVEDIAEKINLLSLNASIEAARAGEAGKGFAVVAGEVRKLAETSKRSAQSISSSLQLFVQQINNLAEQIAAQFQQIDKSNELLQGASDDTMSAADNIQAVSQQIASLVDKLFNETKQLSKVFDNIQSLAAIAEQNSASSEEMSANVTTYSNKIKELMDYINQLEELTASFKGQLEEYRI